jgi:DNA-directed RNA polymerase subunit RPC12/RpoP
MAKEIKVIKCPNCGSVNKVELKPDFYKCSSCQTEYFLDNNDVNINYNHNYNHFNPPSANTERTLKIIGIVIGSIFAFFILIFILTSIFSSKHKNTNAVYSTSATSSREEEDSGFYGSRYSNFAFLQPSNQQPIIVMLENRRYKSNTNEEKNGTYIAFYNPIKKELVAEEKVSNESLSSSDFKFRQFSDGNIYMVNNKTSFLKLDKEKLKTEDVGKKFFEGNPTLQIGVATMEFVYSDNGDGLVLLTNDGKKRYYYPLIQKLYTEDEYYKANNGFNSLLPNAKNKTIHIFTTESSDFPEEKLQLIQITYKDNGAGPKDVTERLRWAKDYGGSGIFTDRDPYRKSLVGSYEKERGRILSWKDVTPDRLYFAPSVLLDDESNLIIQFRADANTKSAYKMQKLNRQNGTIEWTSAVPDAKIMETLIKYKDGYVGVNSSDEMVIIDAKGNFKSNYKLD